MSSSKIRYILLSFNNAMISKQFDDDMKKVDGECIDQSILLNFLMLKGC